MSRKLIVCIATSIDGYIASKNDDLSFLSMVDTIGEDYGYREFINTVDTVIIGKRTYDKVLSMVTEFPHANQETFVITRTPKPAIGNVSFYNDNLIELVATLKAKTGKNIFCDGGAQIIHQLLQHKLIDEFIISIIPTLLGDGIRLFSEGFNQQNLLLVSSKSYESGLVQLRYKLLK
ncbi:MAG: dihydrofolate reductase [Bacteroidia bacterium]|nr:dihydrofolate reductase [Bacteroidia bacterium]